MSFFVFFFLLELMGVFGKKKINCRCDENGGYGLKDMGNFLRLGVGDV